MIMAKEFIKPTIIGIAVVLCALILSLTFRTIIRHNDTISVTGLGETTFVSDNIVWRGQITCDAQDKQVAYDKMEKDQKIVEDYLIKNGINKEDIKFSFIESEKLWHTQYSDGKYNGETFAGYRLTSTFEVVSSDVNTVETVSRSISHLITKGVELDSSNPEYYYSQLDELKLDLISTASADAYARAENVVSHAGAKLGKATSANLGVFQITAANGDEEYSYGGAFNTSSKVKKVRITVRMVYELK